MNKIRKIRIRNIIELDYLMYKECSRLRIERVEDLLKFNSNFLDKVFGKDNLIKLKSFLGEHGLNLKDEKTCEEENLISTADFSKRYFSILNRMGFNTIQELSYLPKKTVARFRGLGKNGMIEIQKAFEKYNLTFRENDSQNVDYETLLYYIFEWDNNIFSKWNFYERFKEIDEILIPMENRTHSENLEIIKTILNKEEYQVICNIYGLDEQKDIGRASSTIHMIERKALLKLYDNLDSLKEGKKVNPYLTRYQVFVNEIMKRINYRIDENQYNQLKEDLLNAMLSRKNEENLLLIRSILNENEYFTICNKYALLSENQMSQVKIAESLEKSPSVIHRYELYGFRKLMIYIDFLMLGQAFVKEDITGKEIYADLTRYFNEEGMIETLEKLPAGYFEKDSFTMKNIGKKSTAFMKKIIDEAPATGDLSATEKEVDKLLDDYKALVDKKRQEYKNKKEKAAFVSRMKAKIGDIKKYHHIERKHMEGHKYNPFADDVEME